MADADSSLTPEQRLLKLIEEGGDGAETQASPASSEKPAAKKRRQAEVRSAPIDWKALLSPAAIRARFEYARDSAKGFFKQKQSQLSLKDVNRLLGAASVLLGGFVILHGLYELHLVSRDFLSQFDISQKKMADLLAPGRQNLGDALSNAGLRNVFAPYTEKAPADEKKSSEIALKLIELTKTLKLTGISFHEGDPSRTFCMIEDIQKNITTFLRQGETLSAMTIKEIRQDSVLLKLGEEEMEIR